MPEPGDRDIQAEFSTAAVKLTFSNQIVCDQDRSCGSRMYESEGYCGGMEDRFAQNSEGAYSHTFIPSRFAPDGGGQKKSQRNLYKQPIPITARRASELLRNCSL